MNFIRNHAPFFSMTNATRIVAVLVFVLIFSGCTRTYISTGAPGVPSPDGSERLCLTSHGAFGRQYVEKTKKKVDVWIGHGFHTNKVTLFLHRYAVVGSDLIWDVQWRSLDEVAVQLYDYGDGVVGPNGTSNHIATLVILRDKQTGKFVEGN